MGQKDVDAQEEDARGRAEEGHLLGSCSRLLIVLLEVAQVDRFGLLDLVHVLKSDSAA